MKSFQIAGLPPDELTSFLTGTHSDPFRILGPHRVGDDLEIRAFRPDARKIDIVLNQQATGAIAAEKIHRDGFFCAKVLDQIGAIKIDELLGALAQPGDAHGL